jgi:hypothetical protein
VKGKYFQPITATARKITTTEIELTLTWSSKKSYINMLLPVKSIHYMSLVTTCLVLTAELIIGLREIEMK